MDAGTRVHDLSSDPVRAGGRSTRPGRTPCGSSRSTRPPLALERPLTAHMLLRQRPAIAPGAQSQPGAVVKDLGTFDGVARDLRDSPFMVDVDIQGIADGTYQLWAELSDGSRALGAVVLPVSLRKGLDDLVASLEAEALRAPADVRADILYPIDRMRHVNRGSLELRTFDPERDFAAALAIAGVGQKRQAPVQRANRRLQASLPAGCGERDHAVSHVRPVEVRRDARHAADHRPPRAGRNRGCVLRQLREGVSAARRKSRLHRRGPARVSRRRIVRMGTRQPAGRSDHPKHAGAQ